MRTLLPSEPPVHLINAYGYDSSIPNSHALNRALLEEIVADIGPDIHHHFVIGGDWNFDPGLFPFGSYL